MSQYESIKTPQDYVNYTFNVSARGMTQVASEMAGLSNTVQTILGEIAFKTSEFLSHTEVMAMGMSAVLTAAFADATKSAIDFQQEVANIQAIGGAGIDANVIGAKAMEFSSKFGMSVSEMTEGLEALARAGINTTNVMTKVLEEGVKLSKLEGMDFEKSMESLITTTNLLAPEGLDMNSPEYAEELKRMNQLIVSASETSPIDAEDIIMTLQHAGGYAAETEIDQMDLFATIAQLGSRGTRGEIAGTALRAFMSAGQKDTAQRALARIGLNVKDLWSADGESMLSISEMKDVLDNAMEARGYSKQEKLEFYSDFVGYKQANQIMKIDTGEIDKYKESIQHAWDLGKKLDIILGTVRGQLNTIWQTLSNFMTNVGGQMLTVLGAILTPVSAILTLFTKIPFADTAIAGVMLFAGFKLGLDIINKLVPSVAGLMSSFNNGKDYSKGLLGYWERIRDAIKDAVEVLENIKNPNKLIEMQRERKGQSQEDRESMELDIVANMYDASLGRDASYQERFSALPKYMKNEIRNALIGTDEFKQNMETMQDGLKARIKEITANPISFEDLTDDNTEYIPRIAEHVKVLVDYGKSLKKSMEVLSGESSESPFSEDNIEKNRRERELKNTSTHPDAVVNKVLKQESLYGDYNFVGSMGFGEASFDEIQNEMNKLKRYLNKSIEELENSVHFEAPTKGIYNMIGRSLTTASLNKFIKEQSEGANISDIMHTLETGVYRQPNKNYHGIHVSQMKAIAEVLGVKGKVQGLYGKEWDEVDRENVMQQLHKFYAEETDMHKKERVIKAVGEDWTKNISQKMKVRTFPREALEQSDMLDILYKISNTDNLEDMEEFFSNKDMNDPAVQKAIYALSKDEKYVKRMGKNRLKYPVEKFIRFAHTAALRLPEEERASFLEESLNSIYNSVANMKINLNSDNLYNIDDAFKGEVDNLILEKEGAKNYDIWKEFSLQFKDVMKKRYDMLDRAPSKENTFMQLSALTGSDIESMQDLIYVPQQNLKEIVLDYEYKMSSGQEHLLNLDSMVAQLEEFKNDETLSKYSDEINNQLSSILNYIADYETSLQGFEEVAKQAAQLTGGKLDIIRKRDFTDEEERKKRREKPKKENKKTEEEKTEEESESHKRREKPKKENKKTSESVSSSPKTEPEPENILEKRQGNFFIRIYEAIEETNTDVRKILENVQDTFNNETIPNNIIKAVSGIETIDSTLNEKLAGLYGLINNTLEKVNNNITDIINKESEISERIITQIEKLSINTLDGESSLSLFVTEMQELLDEFLENMKDVFNDDIKISLNEEETDKGTETISVLEKIQETLNSSFVLVVDNLKSIYMAVGKGDRLDEYVRVKQSLEDVEKMKITPRFTVLKDLKTQIEAMETIDRTNSARISFEQAQAVEQAKIDRINAPPIGIGYTKSLIEKSREREAKIREKREEQRQKFLKESSFTSEEVSTIEEGNYNRRKNIFKDKFLNEGWGPKQSTQSKKSTFGALTMKEVFKRDVEEGARQKWIENFPESPILDEEEAINDFLNEEFEELLNDEIFKGRRKSNNKTSTQAPKTESIKDTVPQADKIEEQKRKEEKQKEYKRLLRFAESVFHSGFAVPDTEEEVIKGIINYLNLNLPLNRITDAYGINDSQFLNWITLGKNTANKTSLSMTPLEVLYKELYEAYSKNAAFYNDVNTNTQEKTDTRSEFEKRNEAIRQKMLKIIEEKKKAVSNNIPIGEEEEKEEDIPDKLFEDTDTSTNLIYDLPPSFFNSEGHKKYREQMEKDFENAINQLNIEAIYDVVYGEESYGVRQPPKTSTLDDLKTWLIGEIDIQPSSIPRQEKPTGNKKEDENYNQPKKEQEKIKDDFIKKAKKLRGKGESKVKIPTAKEVEESAKEREKEVQARRKEERQAEERFSNYIKELIFEDIFEEIQNEVITNTRPTPDGIFSFFSSHERNANRESYINDILNPSEERKRKIEAENIKKIFRRDSDSETLDNFEVVRRQKIEEKLRQLIGGFVGNTGVNPNDFVNDEMIDFIMKYGWDFSQYIRDLFAGRIEGEDINSIPEEFLTDFEWLEDLRKGKKEWEEERKKRNPRIEDNPRIDPTDPGKPKKPPTVNTNKDQQYNQIHGIYSHLDHSLFFNGGYYYERDDDGNLVKRSTLTNFMRPFVSDERREFVAWVNYLVKTKKLKEEQKREWLENILKTGFGPKVNDEFIKNTAENIMANGIKTTDVSDNFAHDVLSQIEEINSTNITLGMSLLDNFYNEYADVVKFTQSELSKSILIIAENLENERKKYIEEVEEFIEQLCRKEISLNQLNINPYLINSAKMSFSPKEAAARESKELHDKIQASSSFEDVADVIDLIIGIPDRREEMKNDFAPDVIGKIDFKNFLDPQFLGLTEEEILNAQDPHAPKKKEEKNKKGKKGKKQRKKRKARFSQRQRQFIINNGDPYKTMPQAVSTMNELWDSGIISDSRRNSYFAHMYRDPYENVIPPTLPNWEEELKEDNRKAREDFRRKQRQREAEKYDVEYAPYETIAGVFNLWDNKGFMTEQDRTEALRYRITDNKDGVLRKALHDGKNITETQKNIFKEIYGKEVFDSSDKSASQKLIDFVKNIKDILQGKERVKKQEDTMSTEAKQLKNAILVNEKIYNGITGIFKSLGNKIEENPFEGFEEKLTPLEGETEDDARKRVIEEIKNTNNVWGVASQKISNTVVKMGELSEILDRVGSVFPPFSAAAMALQQVMKVGSGIAWGFAMAERARVFIEKARLGLINLETLSQQKGLTAKIAYLVATRLQTDAELANAVSKITNKAATISATIAEYALGIARTIVMALTSGPVLAAIAVIVALLATLYVAERRHAEALKEKQEAVSDATKQQLASLSTYESIRQARENETDAIKKQQIARREAIALYQLEIDRIKRRKAIRDETETRNDGLWGEYGARAQWQRFSHGINLTSGEFETQYQNYDGTTKNIRQIKEETLGNIFANESQKMVAQFYDMNIIAFGEIEAYSKELGELYDIESKLIEQYGSIDMARDSQEFADAVQDFCDATGIQAETAVKYLDWLETENKVNQATEAMQLEVDMIVAEAQRNAMAAAFPEMAAEGGFDEIGNAMVYAQASDIYQDAYDQLWWEWFGNTLWGYFNKLLSIVDAFNIFGPWSENADRHFAMAEAYQEGLLNLEKEGVDGIATIGNEVYDNAHRRDYGTQSYDIDYGDTPFGAAKEASAARYADQEQIAYYKDTGKAYTEKEYIAIQDNYQNKQYPSSTVIVTEEGQQTTTAAKVSPTPISNAESYSATAPSTTGAPPAYGTIDYTNRQLKENGETAHKDAMSIIDAIQQPGVSGAISGTGAGISRASAAGVGGSTAGASGASGAAAGASGASGGAAGASGSSPLSPSNWSKYYIRGKKTVKLTGTTLKNINPYIKEYGFRGTMKKGLNVVRNEGVSGVVKRMQNMSEVDSSAKHIKDTAKLGKESLSNKSLSGGIKEAAKTISGKASSGIGGIKGAYKSGGLKEAGKYTIDEVVDAGKAGISGIRGAYQAGGIRNTIDSAKGGIKNAGKSVNMANIKKYGGSAVAEVKGLNTKSLMGFNDDVFNGPKGITGGISESLSGTKQGLSAASKAAKGGGGLKGVAQGLKVAGKAGSKLLGPALQWLGPAITFTSAVAEHNPFQTNYNEDGSEKRALQSTGEVLGETAGAVGGVAGGTVGAAAGAIIGSALGPAGTIVGSMVGGAIGGTVSSMILEPLGEAIGGTLGWLGDELFNGTIEALGGAWDWLSSGAQGIWEGIQGMAGGAWDWLSGGAQGVWDWITGGSSDQSKDPYQNVNLSEDKKEKGQGKTSNSTITIKNININTEDDPEKIKSALMNLIIEMQEQVSPRQVSRTVGEPATAASDASNEEANNETQTEGVDSQNGENNNDTNPTS